MRAKGPKPPASGNYEVGYGKPPVHTRFRKGQSGNPRGSTPRTKPWDRANQLMLKEAYRPVTVRDGERTVRMPAIAAIFRSQLVSDVSNALVPLDLDAHTLDVALRNACGLSERWLAMPPVELKSLVQEIVDRITVAADRIEIQLSRAKIAAALQVGERSQRPDLDPVVLSIEAKLRRG